MKACKVMKLFMALTICLLNSSCATRGHSTKTNYYDLGSSVPSFEAGACPGLFSADPRYDSKMVFRTASGKVEFADYHRWVMPPQLLLESFLSLSFQPAGKPVIDLHIAKLELDETTSEFIFIADYAIKTQGEKLKKRFALRHKVPSATPRAFSKAFKDAAVKMMVEINEQVAKLS